MGEGGPASEPAAVPEPLRICAAAPVPTLAIVILDSYSTRVSDTMLMSRGQERPLHCRPNAGGKCRHCTSQEDK
jgi:hypothetical protein